LPADCPWLNTRLPVEQRVSMLLARMSLSDKLALVHGYGTLDSASVLTNLQHLATPHGPVGPGYSGSIPAQPELCLRKIKLLGGPAGVNHGIQHVTQLPAPVALAATWDNSLAARYGQVVGAEVRGKGADVVLGPAVDIVRDPRWGRAYETYGEDPYLAGQVAAAHITGIQSQGVLAQVKHLAAYNQESYRDTDLDNAIVDERTLQEIYLPAFQSAVRDGHVASVMCSYNLVNGRPACQNNYLMNGVLKGQWGFPGFVTSDWLAVHGTVSAANAGLDMEMPDGCYFGAPLARAVQARSVAESRVNDMVRRILRQEFRFGVVDRPPDGDLHSVVTTPDHAALARTVAHDGTVLLKNQGHVLPLASQRLRSIAVIGADAGGGAVTSGEGSAHVVPPYTVTPYQGIAHRAGSRVSVRYDNGADVAVARRLAAQADVAVVFVGLPEREGRDLASISLSPHDDLLVASVAQANRRTVVVLNTGSAVAMPWLRSAAALVEAWYPGQEDGNAIADVLFGDAEPAGRLPVTFPTSPAQGPTANPVRWPGVGGVVSYDERLRVGYRWYDAVKAEPLFPFGFGLSYTSFRMTNLVAQQRPSGAVDVTAAVTNTGVRAGVTVVQAYLELPATAKEPPRRLVGFAKVRLAAGALTTVHLVVPPQSLSVWDVRRHHWVALAGRYTLRVGSSSRDLPLHASFNRASSLVNGASGPPAPLPAAPALEADRSTGACANNVLLSELMGARSLPGA
jgi:beta-glucosidase